jgi:hypothetical protein
VRCKTCKTSQYQKALKYAATSRPLSTPASLEKRIAANKLRQRAEAAKAGTAKRAKNGRFL